MAQNHQTPCQRCQEPAYGKHRRACSNLLLPIQERVKKPHPSVNTVGEFNAGGFSGNAGIAFPQVVPTIGPWWIGLSREEFYQQACEQSDRMSRGVCGNIRVESVA